MNSLLGNTGSSGAGGARRGIGALTGGVYPGILKFLSSHRGSILKAEPMKDEFEDAVELVDVVDAEGDGGACNEGSTWLIGTGLLDET